MTEQPLMELDIVHDIFISGIGAVQVMGPNARVTLYVDHGGERVVVAKVIVPIEAIPGCINIVMKATWNQLTHISLLEVSEADRVGRH